MFENGNLNGNTGAKKANTSYLALYFAIAKGADNAVFYPLERQQEIDGVKDMNLKAQKQTSWKLLEYAIGDTLNKGIEDFSFKKLSGKWTTSEFCFSISHSNNLVCVGISDAPVGVDIESQSHFLKRVKDPAKFLDKIATDSEKKLYKSPSIGWLLQLWTGKESNFKRGNSDVFVPSKTEIDVNDTRCACVVQECEKIAVTKLNGYETDYDFSKLQEGERYMLAICSEKKTDCKLNFVDLSKDTKVRL